MNVIFGVSLWYSFTLMENAIFIIAICFALGVIHIVQTAEKIKRAREVGKKLHKKNLYYALIARFFVKDLPD